MSAWCMNPSYIDVQGVLPKLLGRIEGSRPVMTYKSEKNWKLDERVEKISHKILRMAQYASSAHLRVVWRME